MRAWIAFTMLAVMMAAALAGFADVAWATPPDGLPGVTPPCDSDDSCDKLKGGIMLIGLVILGVFLLGAFLQWLFGKIMGR